MSLKITKLTVKDSTRNGKRMSRPTFFVLDLQFTLKNDSDNDWDNPHPYFEELLEFHSILYITDPEQYVREISASLKKHGKDYAAALKEPTKIKWKKAYTLGADSAKRNGDKYRMGGYYSYTPVTRAILHELERMRKDPNHSYKTIPEQYLAHLLLSLATFWD